MSRIDRLGDQVTALKDDIMVNMEMASHVQTAGESTRQEMRGLGEVVTSMQRQIRRLQARMDEADKERDTRQ